MKLRFTCHGDNQCAHGYLLTYNLLPAHSSSRHLTDLSRGPFGHRLSECTASGWIPSSCLNVHPVRCFQKPWASMHVTLLVRILPTLSQYFTTFNETFGNNNESQELNGCAARVGHCTRRFDLDVHPNDGSAISIRFDCLYA